MRCLFTLVLSALLLAACAHQPPPPDWLLTARSASEQHARFYLEGRDRLAQSQLQTARAAVSRTGNASAMARIELHACAARIASLQPPACPEFQPLADDAGQAENAYFRYLTGQLVEGDLALLPVAQQAAWRNPSSLSDIADSLSRLLAAAALLHAGRLPPSAGQIAIDTASQQGWRRPLVHWLQLEEERLNRAGDAAAAAAMARQRARVLADLPEAAVER
ncbi:hypothetical protein MASR1M42_22120 [Azonexus hydrophilus]